MRRSRGDLGALLHTLRRLEDSERFTNLISRPPGSGVRIGDASFNHLAVKHSREKPSQPASSGVSSISFWLSSLYLAIVLYLRSLPKGFALL